MTLNRKQFERLHAIICRSLFNSDSSMTFERTLIAIEKLGMLIEDTDTDESVGYIGETAGPSLADVITGAYWFAADYHGGQASAIYTVLSVLSGIFNPGYTNGPSPGSSERDVYNALVSKGGFECIQ